MLKTSHPLKRTTPEGRTPTPDEISALLPHWIKENAIGPADWVSGKYDDWFLSRGLLVPRGRIARQVQRMTENG